jgi:AraC-like DNA-binding protein
MRGLNAALILLLGLPGASARAEEIPYRTQSLRIDGALADWGEQGYRAEFVEPAAGGNRVLTRIAWDWDALYLGLHIDDADLVLAPPALTAEQYHQYDSVQIYIDPQGDDANAMNRDDVDIILLPDGRSGVLRGDELVAALTRAQVAQRQGAPLALDYAAQRDAQGWSLELRLPFAGLGLAPRAGHSMRLDVAMNDWLVDHAPAIEPGFDAQSVRENVVEPTAPDPAVGTQLLPRTWTGRDDFGYPQHWRRLRLIGEPPALERWVRAYGLGALLTGVALIMVILLSLGLGAQAWLFRRRLRALLTRLPGTTSAHESVVSAQALADMPDAAASPQTVDAESLANKPYDPRERAFADDVLAYVRANLRSALTPAELAERFHVSVRTLQRRLRAGMGTSPQDLVLAARLDAARELLRSGSLRVSEVAYAVGFEDLSHFAKRFRVAYGAPPSQLSRSGKG